MAKATVSGAEPQRGILQELVLRKLAGLPGRGIVALGLPGQRSHERIGNAEVYCFLNRQEQQEAMARSHVVVARAGYSTIMELAALGKKAVLVPTPGLTEQGYLARRHQRLGSCHSVQQGSLDPPRDIARALKLPGFRAPNTTGEAVERFVEGFLADLKRGAAPLPTLRPSPFR
jgi:UDP:flavonoid glycosyltransferase YjiC (YdhE family)